jgi:hypothetical protein
MAERKLASTQRQVTIRFSRGDLFALILEMDQDIGSIPPEKYGEETSRSVSKGLKKLRDDTELYIDEVDFCVWNPEKDRYKRIKQEDILPNVLKGREVYWQNLKAHGVWFYGEWRAESEDDSCSVEGDVSQWIEFDDWEQEESSCLTSSKLTREAARIIYLYSARYKESETDFFWSRLIPWSKYDRPRALSRLEELVFMVCQLKVEHELKRLVRRFGIEDMYQTVLGLGWESLDKYSDEWVGYHWQFDFGERLILKIDEILSASKEGYGCLDADMVEKVVRWLRELIDDKEFWKIEPLSDSSYSLWEEEEDAVVSKRLDDDECGTRRKGLQHAKQGKVRKNDENKLPRAMLHVQKEISRSGRRRKMTEKMAALAKNGCLA